MTTVRRMIVSLTLSFAVLLIGGHAAASAGGIDADLAGNGWGNGSPAIGD
ncbi:hypothetical protein AB0B28_17605 [Glycomyces sp. NPDC046736]